MSGPRTYRKRPVDVEALQWTGDNPAAMREFTGVRKLDVAANDTWMPIEVGEWVLRDRLGFYPCKPDVFAETYEEPNLAMIANEHATEPREPESLFPPRVRALVEAILASRDVLPEGGRIEMLPHPSREVVVKVEIGAVLPVDVVRGIESFEMVAPPPPRMVNVGTYLDPDREERVETVHLSRGAGVTACCKRTLFELPRDERTTTDPMGVTCEGPR